MPIEIIYAFAYLKKAAALVNAELTDYSQQTAQAISDVCENPRRAT